MHPSLRTYIACFLSNPLPKMYPRGGGAHDQDPQLMRDFRAILKVEREWKEAQSQISEAKSNLPGGGGSGGGGFGGLEQAMEQHLEAIGEDGLF